MCKMSLCRSLLLMFWALPLLASSLRLSVKDAAGLPLTASGRIRASASGIVTAFETGADGLKLWPDLPAGRYRIEITANNFAPQTIDIDLRAAAVLERTVTMTIGPSNFQLDVVSTTPLSGIDRDAAEIPAVIQTATSADLANSGALNLPDYLSRRINGVYLNEIQGNPFQMDLSYRGFTVSPLLGTPQGISIYFDGVRMNQPFGDIISWDLIPTNAISELSLVPGSNPLFGLNTLGGAIALETKDGRRHPGTEIQLGSGAFARKTANLEHGGSNRHGFDWFASTSLFFEDGWRDSSPSNVRQFLGKLGHQTSNSSLAITASYANNSLTGNGLQEHRLLAANRTSVYTKPDQNNQRSPFLNLRGRRALPGRWSLAGNLYYRHIDAATLNGDINEGSLDQSLYNLSGADQAALRAAGYSGFQTSGYTPFPYWRCIAQVLLRDEPEEKCNGLINRSQTQQANYGLSGQLSWQGNQHQLTVGAAYDGNRVGFLQSSQFGYLTPDRSVIGQPAFSEDDRVDLKSRIHTASLYATDTITAFKRWHLTLSGRYNRSRIDNRDRILPGGGPGSLDGNHLYQRFNPAVGLTFRGGASWNAYFGYAEGSRAPTAIELGCADPNSPCRLPNALAGDPPLKQVVTRTFEAGLRGGLEGTLKWNIGWFRAANRDDLLFVASQQTGFGYFKNFGGTRRQGLESAFQGNLGRFTWGANYTWLAATFESPEQVNGAANSTSSNPGFDGIIRIEPGARIPMSPRHLGKAYADWTVTRKLTIDLGWSAVARSFARGNENNLHQPDGRLFVGPGENAGFGLANLGARYQLTPRLQFYVQVNNLFDKQYSSAAQLGPTGFDPRGNFIARPFPAVNGEYPLQSSTFVAPGAPRGAWAGLRFRF